MSLTRIVQKFRQEGIKGAAKAVGRSIQGRFFTTGYGIEVISPILEEIWKRKGSVVLVEVGANIGNTGSDPLYQFITQHFTRGENLETSKNRAVLIEPVTHLYAQLLENYAGYEGVRCINVAVAESSGTKTFYRFRDGIDPDSLGLPPFAHQLGSFDRENILAACPQFADAPAREAFLQANVVESEVPCRTLQEILDQEGIEDLDLLVIDAEGYDYEILKTVDFSKRAPTCINYERTHLGKDQAACRRLLFQHGYALHDHADDTLCTKDKAISPIERLVERIYITWLGAIY